MSGQRDLQAAGVGARTLALLAPSLLAGLLGCNGILGLDASTLEEGGATGTTSSSAASTTATGTTSTPTSTSTGGATGSGGNGGAGGEATSTSSGGGGGDPSGSGGGGSDPCGPGTWGILQNGGFECGLLPWSADGAAQLETFTPGFGDRGTAARFGTPDVDNPVRQPLGQVELEAATCFVSSYAARSSDGSGQIAASLVILDSPGYFLRGAQRNLNVNFAHHGPLACRIPDEFVGSFGIWFTFDVAGLSDGATASIDSVVATLGPCLGGEPECVQP